MSRPLPALSILLVALQWCSAAPPTPDRASFAAQKRELGQVPLSAFELNPDVAADLRIEVWAQSPLIFSPVAMDIDPQGRIWATEGIDYNSGRRILAGQSIVVLTDADNDGRADKSQVFVTEKNLRHAPLGLAVFDNRIVLSATPSIIVYTDVDRNAVFDPAIDKREVFLTGFQNRNHDHTLHAVVGGPNGQWYFSYGNCGADLKTKDGRHFLSGCYYGYPEAIGKPSSDGHVYVGGLAMRVNPDGTGLTPVGENMRNSHDMFVTSTGDVLQSDNDDPAHCRSSWLMEFGNMGYSDLRDGSRSWEEVAKTWEEPSGWHKDLRYSRSHWRENYPGATPPGTVYGAGSPTGNVYLEGGELGAKMKGRYLVCDMVRKEVMMCLPKLIDAQIEMGPHQPLLQLKAAEKGRHFLPTDVVLGTDGSLFVSDFYNDTSRRTNQVTGTIYRISRKEEEGARPKIDFETKEGLIVALKNPAVNVRVEAVRRLVERGEVLIPLLKEFLGKEFDSHLQARAIWVLAQLGPRGRELVAGLLRSRDQVVRLVAFRALRFVDAENLLQYSEIASRDESAAVRREVALALRDVPLKNNTADQFIDLVIGYDGHNRWYLEALGIAASGKEREMYALAKILAPEPPEKWDTKMKNLAWRLHTPEAIDDLFTVMQTQKPKIEEFRHLAMAFASFRNDGERVERRLKLEKLATLPAFAGEDYQITIKEIIAKDLNALKGEGLDITVRVPTQLGAKTVLSSVEKIAALKGDAARGKLKAQSCLLCHKIEGKGVAFGPELSSWGQPRTIPEIVKEMVDPAAKLAHGYDRPVRLRKGKHVAEGFLMNFSWHAGSLRIKLFGGEVRKILFRRKGVVVEELKDHSWMPPASEMGLEDQDVRDIAAYLKEL